MDKTRLDEMLKIQEEFGGIPLDELFYQSDAGNLMRTNTKEG